MECNLNKTSAQRKSNQQISSHSIHETSSSNDSNSTCIKLNPDEMECNLNKTSQRKSNQQISSHSIHETSSSNDSNSTCIKLDPDEMEFNLNKTGQSVSKHQIPLSSPLKYEVKEEIMYCQFCAYCDIDFDRLKFHIIKQHPVGAAVVNFGESKHDIKLFCVKETCNFSTTTCTDYEEHLMNCCPFHETLSGIEKGRLKSTLKFVLDFHKKLHGLGDVTGLLEYLSSLEKIYGSEDENVQFREHMEHGDLISAVSTSSYHSNVHPSMAFGNVGGRNLKFLSVSNLFPVHIVQNKNTNPTENQANLTENISMSVRKRNKKNDCLIKTGPSEMNISKCQVHTHMETETKEKSCAECDKCFCSRSNLLTHRRIHSVEKPFKCDVCDKGFTTSGYRNRHKRRHNVEKPFKCDVCGKGFMKSIYLSRHKRSHNGEKPFKCNVCDKGFTKSSSLSRHKRRHNGEKPFKCDVCDKVFAESYNLLVHKRTHTGEKPFKCNVCDKGFTTSSHLILHKRIHTGEKPFKCDMCDKQFTISSHLIVHKRVHTGEKPLKCDVCDKGFADFTTLIRHKRTHTNGKPLKCNVCSSSHFILHKRRHAKGKTI